MLCYGFNMAKVNEKSRGLAIMIGVGKPEKQDKMENQEKGGACVVSMCEATDCSNNKNRQCTLPEITIGSGASCENYTKSSKPTAEVETEAEEKEED